jgi:PII-like signaling protein
MKMEGDGKLLRIFVGEDDQWEGKPLYQAIVLRAREAGIAGATVLRGFLGYGANSHLHTTKVLRLSDDLPIVIEIVDTEEKINAVLPLFDEMVKEGMMTVEKVNVIVYRSSNKS